MTLHRSSHWPALVFFAVMAAIGPLLMDAFWQSLLTLVFFYAFMGLSWNLMMSAGLLSLGHALFLGLGAYATAVLSAAGGVNPWLAIAAGAVISAIVGSALTWLGGRFSVRGVQFALLTIAFAELFRVVFDNWDLVGGTGGFFLKAINPDTNRPLASLRGGTLFFYLAFLDHHRRRLFPDRIDLMASRWGYRWRGLSEDEEAARALGVPALRSKVFVVAISAGLAGVGGGLFGLMQGSLFPDSVMGMRMSIESPDRADHRRPGLAVRSHHRCVLRRSVDGILERAGSAHRLLRPQHADLRGRDPRRHCLPARRHLAAAPGRLVKFRVSA